MIKLYMYKGCDSCRKAKKWLQSKSIDFKEVAIREEAPSKSELREALLFHDMNLRRLFNVSGGAYRAMDLKEKLPKMSQDEALDLLQGNGNLVKRPFLVTEKACAAGFDPEIWEDLVS